MKIYSTLISLPRSLHCNNIVITKFSFSYHYYVYYAEIKTKNIIFLVNNKINFATTFTTPGSWKITYFYFTTTTTTFPTAISCKKTDKPDCKWLRGTTSDYEWLQLTTSQTTSDYKWLRMTASQTASDYKHGNIIRTGITCKEIPCYMRDSACRWFIVKKAKIFWSYVKHFWILAGVRKCRILIGLCK